MENSNRTKRSAERAMKTARIAYNPVVAARIAAENKADRYLENKYQSGAGSSNWLYWIAIAIAVFKDFLDLIFIGSLPVIGTVITFCAAIAIMFILILAGSSGKRRMVRGMMNKLIILFTGTLAEGILFGINFLPLETITVGIIYLIAKKEQKIARKQEELGDYGAYA